QDDPALCAPGAGAQGCGRRDAGACMTVPLDYEARMEALRDQFKELAPTGQAVKPTYIAGVQIDVTPEQSAYWVALRAATLAQVHHQPTPAWARDVERDVVLGILERLHREFLATGNAMCACEAYRVARRAGLELPDWVFNWLDRGFDDFWAKVAVEGDTVVEGS